MTSIEERADIAYGKNPTNYYAKHKEEYKQNIIKKNKFWRQHSGGRLGESTATHSHHGFQIQSVLVPKRGSAPDDAYVNGFSKSEAIKYVKDHFQYNTFHSDWGLKGVKPPISTQRKNFYSFRQFDPTENSKYFTKILDNGVELVFEKAPIGKDSIKPHFLKNIFGQVFEGTKDNEVDRRPVKSEGGSLKVNEIYRVIKNGYEWPKAMTIPQFKIIKDLSSKYHQVYESHSIGEKRIIINYTGSKGVFDLLNNIDYLLQTYPLTPRFLKAKDLFNKVLKEFPTYTITLVSHSQGGIITRELSRVYGNEIFEIIAVNPAESSFVEDIKSFFGEGKRNKENEYNIKSELDFASFFGKKSKHDIVIPKESNDIIKEHKSEILLRLNPDTEIGRRKTK